jgi:CheY-like chemotaxis protein
VNTTDSEALRFFVLEDEALVAMFVEDVLGDLGCVVAGMAASVASALEFIEASAGDIDAAILDVNLGRETAYPVASALAARQIPFAFATGYGVDGISREFADAPVIAKPFAEEALSALVRELRRAREQREK